MTRKASVVGGAKSSVRVESRPVVVGSLQEVSRGSGAMSTGVENVAIGFVGRISIGCWGLDGIRAKIEAVGEGAEATKMVNGEG